MVNIILARRSSIDCECAAVPTILMEPPQTEVPTKCASFLQGRTGNAGAAQEEAAGKKDTALTPTSAITALFCRCGALQRAVRHHAPGHSHQQGHEVYQVPQICTPAGGTSRQWKMPGVLRVDDANMPSGQPDSGASARQTAAWKAGGAPERRSSLMAVESSEARRPLTTAMRYRAPPNTHDTTPPQWMKLMPPAMRASSRPEPQPPAPRPARPRPAAMAGAGARPAGGAGAALPGRRGPGGRGGGRGRGNNGSGRPSSGGCAPQLAPPCCPARTVTDAAWWPGPGRRRAGVQYRLHGPSGSLPSRAVRSVTRRA